MIRRSCLRGADLSGASLIMADLSQCDLRDVDFSGADLSGCNLRTANMENANLSNARFEPVDVFGDGSRMWPTNMEYCRLTNADIRGAKLWQAVLRGADLTGAKGVKKAG